MNFQRRKLSDLKQYANNPRDNTNAVEKVKLSILRYGYKVPIVIDSDNVIVAGHTRFAALLQINAADSERFAEITVVMADDLDNDQLKEFRIVDNQVAGLSSWDFTRLQMEIGGLEDFVLEEFGIIPGFDTELVIPDDNPITEADANAGISIKIGTDKITMTEAEFHSWASWCISEHNMSVLDFVKERLCIDPNTRTYSNKDI